MEITILGTGSGIGLYKHSYHDQAGPSVLIDIDGDIILMDAGRSALQNVFKSHHNPDEVKHIFLSHLHSDHIIGLPDLILSPWVAFKKTNWNIGGPEGTCEMLDAFFGPDGAFKLDITARCSDLKLDRPKFNVTEINQPGVICSNEIWEISASYCPKHVQPHLISLAYRINSSWGSVVYTGDTGPHIDVIKFAKGCDVLIHDCAIRERTGVYSNRLVHTDPTGFGEVAEKTGAEIAVAFHFKDRTMEEIELMKKNVKKNFSGKFIVAKDLVKLEL